MPTIETKSMPRKILPGVCFSISRIFIIPFVDWKNDTVDRRSLKELIILLILDYVNDFIRFCDDKLTDTRKGFYRHFLLPNLTHLINLI